MQKTDVLILALLLTVGCGGSAPDTQTHDAPQSAAAPTAQPTGNPPASADQSSDFAPINSRGASTPNVAAPPPSGDTAVDHLVEAPGALFTIPAAWVPQAPSVSMRMAQAGIPGEGGEALLTAFYFGPGSGGGVESNLQRWAGQVEPDPGVGARRETFDVNGFRVTWMEVQGTLMPTGMGTGPTTPQPNSRLLGAVVEGPQGPWFFKATGPASTLEAQRDAFLSLLRSVQPRG